MAVLLAAGLLAAARASDKPYVPNVGCMPAACCPVDLPMSTSHAGNAQIVAPKDLSAAGIAKWMASMKAMRTACQEAIGYTGEIYDVEGLKWTQTAFISPQMHPYDRFFFDPELGNGTDGAGYTVDKWLGDLNRRYGGIDKALIWPTYTQIGIDDRNTWDLIRTLPGGVEGVAKVVDQLHERGVKVLWPYHPWDHSTRDQEKNNVTDFVSMAEVLRDTHSDGFNADTMSHVPKAFYDAAVKIYKPIAMEPEGGLSSTWDLNYMTLGWAEGWSAFELGAIHNAPNVDKPKWLTNGKAMHNWCDRWSGDRGTEEGGQLSGLNKTAELQVSFFNGLGYESWENVWGTWNGITERDGESIRRVATLLRYFGRRGFLTSSEWVPYTPAVQQMHAGVFASAFPHETSGEIVYFLVNMVDKPVSGRQLKLSTNSTVQGEGGEDNDQEKMSVMVWHDCFNGVELNADGGYVSFEIEANGFGCVVGSINATSSNNSVVEDDHELAELAAQLRSESPPVPTDLAGLLKTMAALTQKPITSFSPAFHYLNQTMVDADEKTAPLRGASSVAAGETYVYGGDYHFMASGVELEGNHDTGVDVQYPWEHYPHRWHDHMMYIGAMIVDTHPVTNAEYAEYLSKSKYHPKDDGNWLKHSFEDGKVKPGWENKPVTYVSIDDARAYCRFNKKRLPKPYEWQYFSQGGDETRLYPWGNVDDISRTPILSQNFTNPGPEPVGKYPQGASPFGIQDLVRSVWQYTSEFQDIHNRAVVLRGGSNYSPYRGQECRWIEANDGTPRDGPQNASNGNGIPACWNRSVAGYEHRRAVDDNVLGSYDPATGKNLSHPMGGSNWYFPPAFQLNTYNKYYLMSGTYERAGTVGFRCVADAEDTCGTNGKLCAEETTPPTKAHLSATGGLADWALFGATGGDAIRMPKGKIIGSVRPMPGGEQMVVAGATNFSWAGGPAGHTIGATDQALAFTGSAGGFEVTATAPPAGKKRRLSLYVGGLMGAHGHVEASIQANAGGASAKNLSIISDGSLLDLTYTGPLLVRYTSVPGTVCEGELCVLPLASADQKDVQHVLSEPSCAKVFTPSSSGEAPGCVSRGKVVDWAHFGGSEPAFDQLPPVGTSVGLRRLEDTMSSAPTADTATGSAAAPCKTNPCEPAPWYQTNMVGGLGVFHPRNTSKASKGAAAPSFWWEGGSPVPTAMGANTGMLTTGTILMTIPAAAGAGVEGGVVNGTERRKLIVWVGALNCTGKLTVTSHSSGKTVTQMHDTTKQPPNTMGEDNIEKHNSQSLQAVVIFEGSVTIAWEMLGGGNVVNPSPPLAQGHVWLSAATLETFEPDVGGVLLQAITAAEMAA